MEDEGKLLAQHRKPPSLHGHGLLPHSLHPQHSLQHQHLQQHHHPHQHPHHPQHQQQQHQQQQHQQHHQQLAQHQQHHTQQQQQQQQHQQQQHQQHPGHPGHQQHPQHPQHPGHQQHQQHQQHGHQQLPQHQQLAQHPQHSLPADHNFLAVCAERDALIMQRDTAVAEKEAACAERDAAILQRDTVINEYKVVVAALDSLKAEREAALQGRKRYPDVAAEGSKLLQVATVNMPDNCSFSDDYDLLSNRSGQLGMGMGLDVDTTAKPAKQAPAKEAGKKHPRTSTPSKKAAAGGAAGQAPKRRKSPAKKPGQWQDGQEYPDGVKLEDGAEAAEGTVPPPPPKPNGRPHYDSATTPIPYCSCTGVTQQCYRWGNGGWQSACCTNQMSQYPLPMNPKKRGSRMAGRKMSAGAFEKLLEKLATEGVNINYPVDLKDHWAKHGTNRYVTLK